MQRMTAKSAEVSRFSSSVEASLPGTWTGCVKKWLLVGGRQTPRPPPKDAKDLSLLGARGILVLKHDSFPNYLVLHALGLLSFLLSPRLLPGQVRYMALTIIGELFRRSTVVRAALVADLKVSVEKTTQNCPRSNKAQENVFGTHVDDVAVGRDIASTELSLTRLGFSSPFPPSIERANPPQVWQV